MTIFFVSDMHFGHKNIIKYCNRPFNSVEEMDEILVENWNNIVGTGDRVYHLGDWAFHNFHHIGRLKGNIISIPGNHDREYHNKIIPFLPNGFTKEVEYVKLDSKVRLTLCHFPFETWHRHYPIHLHGHTHGMDDNKYIGYRGNIPHRLDVGIDATKLYRPISLEEVIEKLTK